MIADAGDDLFSWRFATHYGLTADLNPLWARFLDGRLSAEALAEQTQALTDKVRTDPEVEHYTVS